jgi:hypothetical protein
VLLGHLLERPDAFHLVVVGPVGPVQALGLLRHAVKLAADFLWRGAPVGLSVVGHAGWRISVWSCLWQSCSFPLTC